MKSLLRKWVAAWAVLLWLAGGGVGVFAATPAVTAMPENLVDAELHAVVGGDTLVFFLPRTQDLVEARLDGVEGPPEVKPGSRVQDFRKEAIQWLKKRLHPVIGQDCRIRLLDLGEVENVRHVVVFVGENPISVNEEIVSKGLGKSVPAIHSDLNPRLQAAEQRAVLFRKGIWDVAKQETHEISVNIAQGREIKTDEAFFNYTGRYEKIVYEIKLVFRNVKDNKIYFTEIAMGRNTDSPPFQNEVELPIVDRLAVWDYHEFGRDNAPAKRFRFGVYNNHVWLLSQGEGKKQLKVISP